MKALGIFFVVILSTIFSAYVTTELWQWFLVPLGLPKIGMAHAWGIVIFVRFITYQYKRAEAKPADDKALIDATFQAIMLPLMAWAFGALAYALM